MRAGFDTVVAPVPDEPASPVAFTPPALAEVAQLFPQLEIVELLGRGGMGAVYRARQPALDRWVALKVLPPQSTARPGFAERFTREARAMARLSHANIVAVYEFGQAGSMPYFVMEYVEGVTLRRLVQERRLGPGEALRIVPQICEALQFAHDEGVVHRDIKPENILLDKKGRVKIADFGIAKIVTGEPAERTITQDQVLGTPHYMAPEQVEHPQAVDHRADIYSLGVVFYEMLTGELPLGKFQAPSRKVHVDVRLDEVVLHTLEKEPERRYQHASEVKSDLATIAGSTPVTPPAGRSGMVRLAEACAGIAFRSPVAINLVKISALGFLGFLSTLGTRWSGGFSAFFAFFGLIGVAYLIEIANRRRAAGPPSSDRSRGAGDPTQKTEAEPHDRASAPAAIERSTGVSGWPRRRLIPEDTVAQWAQRLAFGAALAILVLGFLELPKFDLRPHELFFGVLLVLILTLVMVVAGSLIGAVNKNRWRQGLASLGDAPVTSTGEGALAAARQAVNTPASWLVATGILNWVLLPVAAVVSVWVVPLEWESRGWGPLTLSKTAVGIGCAASMVLCSFTILAALKMKRLEAYGLAVTGSLLAMVIAPGNIIGLPVGVWSLAVLGRREVRDAFGKRRWQPGQMCAGQAECLEQPRGVSSLGHRRRTPRR